MDTATTTGAAAAAAAVAVADRRYDAALDELADIAGALNIAHGRLVDLTILTLAEGHHVGPGLHTPAQYLAWRTGIAKATANKAVRIARRADELPHLLAALRAGHISLDQADVVARYAPARYDRAATRLAATATVEQLRAVLPAYAERPTEDPDGQPPRHGLTLTRHRDHATLRGTLGNDDADLFEQALAAMREDLLRQRQDDARRASTEGNGTDGERIDPPTTIDALVALAETALRAGEAAHPGADRYLISYHLHAGPDGHLSLTDDFGRPIERAERRRILCDSAGEATFHDANGVPLSVGRRTRTIGPKLRRAILHRHHHTCAVPGCDTTRGLQIHHLHHWEDGGRTDTANLVPLCGHHHRSHHQGHLHITGNPDLPPGTPGALQVATPHLDPIPPLGTRRPGGADLRPRGSVLDPGPKTARTLARLRRHLDRRARHDCRRTPPTAQTPTGERLDRRTFHLSPDPPHLPPPEPPSRR